MSSAVFHSRRRTPCQAGQALVESLVAMLGLAALWVALHWLANYQDIALSAVHASRHAAFAASRMPPEEIRSDVTGRFFSGSAHRWADRQGHAVLDSQLPVRLSWQRLQPLSAQAQPGAGHAASQILRRDWLLEDAGVLQARIAPGFATDVAGRVRAHGLRLQPLELSYPPLVRSTGILTGAGHAASDAAVQSRVAASGLAWTAAYSASQLAGGDARTGAGGVDAAWGRPQPDLDWLQPWSGRVPPHLITRHAQAGQ